MLLLEKLLLVGKASLGTHPILKRSNWVSYAAARRSVLCIDWEQIDFGIVGHIQVHVGHKARLPGAWRLDHPQADTVMVLHGVEQRAHEE
jgi:hypothetical protein